MIAIPLLAALLIGAPQDSSTVTTPTPPPATSTMVRPQLTPEQQAQVKQKMEQFRASHEPIRKEAIRINDLAGNIQSEADARKLVDSVAEVLTNHRHLLWAAQKYRHRVAHAEFEAVSDPSGLIPEQRIVDVWNEYVREIDAPEETLISVADVHNLRDSMYIGASRFAWKRELMQSIWTMPNIYAMDADGKLASGCRALETLKIIHDIHETYSNLSAARERVHKGVLASDLLKQKENEQKPASVAVAGRSELRVVTIQDPIRPAVYRYQQEHGGHAYDQLVRRLFDELFPPE